MPISDRRLGIGEQWTMQEKKENPQQCRGLNKIGNCALHGVFLFYDVNILFFAHIFKYFWPNGGGDLADVGLFQDEHKGSGLANAAANTQWDVAIYDSLVIGEFQEIKLASHFELNL